MDIVDRLKVSLLGMGARPILWLLLGLSVLSFAVIVERVLFFVMMRDDVARLRRDLAANLRRHDRPAAHDLLAKGRGIAAAVVLSGLAEADRGEKSAERVMSGELAIQRERLERGLAFLGTLGNNAPFLGLLGTVVGIVESFDRLGASGGVAGDAAASSVMSGIAEALVSTAVGLAVAIPAIVAFNYFQRNIKSRIAATEALSSILLAYISAAPADPPIVTGED